MSVPIELEDGFVPVDTMVDGPQQLEAVLSHWTQKSNSKTVGKIGTFGGSPVITVKMGPHEFVLNRDTTRAAVQEFLAAAARAGGASNLRWHVTRNLRGQINKVSYRSDDAHIPGWFAYLRQPIAVPQELGFTVRHRVSAPLDDPALRSGPTRPREDGTGLDP